MKKIKDFEKHQECPGINGIYFADDTVYPLKISQRWSKESGDDYLIKVHEKMSVIELESSYNIESWHDCSFIVDKEFPEYGFRVYAGQSDFGSDGFISVLDINTNDLIWLAFFDCSDPFCEVTIDENKLIAESTNGSRWLFSISNPMDVQVNKK